MDWFDNRAGDDNRDQVLRDTEIARYGEYMYNEKLQAPSTLGVNTRGWGGISNLERELDRADEINSEND